MSEVESKDGLGPIPPERHETRGLKLTAAQASRFWNLDPDESRMLLDRLVEERALLRTPDGHYVLLAGSALPA